jgi:putative GTP pyrophosphokinase
LTRISADSINNLGEDRVGYRSTHFVASLGEGRGRLAEYENLGDLKFEVQVRTVLQHAWAKLAHDRSYKLRGVFSSDIQRRINLYSAMLEVVDRAFDDIVKEIDNLKSDFALKQIDHISDLELDSISLTRAADDLAERFDLDITKRDQALIILDELKKYGITTVGGIEDIVTENLFEYLRSRKSPRTAVSVLRLIIMYDDVHRYFDEVNPSWTLMSAETFEYCLANMARKR